VIFTDFDDITSDTYRVIYADPAWTYVTYSAKGKDRSPEKHYGCMTLDAIKALPVRRIAAKDSVLLMWCIDTHVPQMLEVMDAWGFKFKTRGFEWAKLNKSGDGFFTGLGHWTRANPESCWLGTRGKPKRSAKDVRRLIVAPRREHSRKPDEVYERIERLLPGPGIELFARQERPGWDSWGNEVTRFNQ
jgi:N6-adenosine-specific RNA methylase IME4